MITIERKAMHRHGIYGIEATLQSERLEKPGIYRGHAAEHTWQMRILGSDRLACQAVHSCKQSPARIVLAMPMGKVFCFFSSEKKAFSQFR
jgi:hypothetical protein